MPIPFRPPWAVSEPLFQETCTTCDACIKVCGEGVLRRGGGGYPEVNFQAAECTFCGECVNVCTPQALLKTEQNADAPWDLKARIAATCLSQNAITCRVCGDRCDARAIRFQLAVGGVADPIIDLSSCTGCGACVEPCPVDAVEIYHNHMEEQS